VHNFTQSVGLETEVGDYYYSVFEKKNAVHILKWAVQKFGNKVALASSFGAEDVVLIDIFSKIVEKPRVFTLDTGRLPQETYEVIDEIRARYGISIEVFFPDTESVEKMVRNYGLNLFYKSIDLRKMCCNVRKVEPLNRALATLDAWVTGLRREQAFTRAQIKKVELDKQHNNMIKINPIADWTSEKVWRYIKRNKIPYNKLHDQGYPSIGCAPCTRPVHPGDDPRAGRWWWEQGPKECGLHLQKEIKDKREIWI
jgi:phosphoadenosine phosphosulfate reductase